MLSYLKLRNFKSFSDVCFDLRGAHGLPKKTAFIYGENGSGKSNLMFSFLFLSRTLDTLKNQERMKKLKDPKFAEMIESIDDSDIKKEFIEHLLRSYDLTDLIKEYKTLKSTSPMYLEIGFYLEEKRGTYALTFDEESVVFEELRYQITERMGTIFRISAERTVLSPSIFYDTEYRQELLDDIEKYWGKHTFMSILSYEKTTKNLKYMKSRVKGTVFTVLDWLNTCSVLCKYTRGETSKVALPYGFLQELDRGTLEDKDDKKLKIFEDALNEFFTQLYSDIKGVYYKITPAEDKFRYELYFKKQVYGKILDIPLSLESTGTKKLLDLFPFIFSSVIGKTVFIDEIDSGVHDLLMCNIMDFLEESIRGQFIATTHNTLLMRHLPNENVYIIRTDADGNKEIVCIKDYEFRTQRTNNTQNKYLEGDYKGIPYVGVLDFEEMADEIVEQLPVHPD